MKHRRLRHILHSIYTFANVCGALIAAACVLVCGVTLKRGDRSWTGNGLMTDTIVFNEPPVDIFQTETIAEEIKKARQYRLRKETRRPKKFVKKDGQISPFDDLFKKYAATMGWDWHLFAAVSYVESHFNPVVVSPSGASGLMQLMPRTAANYGCTDSLLVDPEANIRAGAMLLADLERRLRRKNIDQDAVYFALAGFHAGLGHIYDAILLADSLGFDPTLWHGNVERALQLKAEPEYYNLPYLRLGRFNGKITSAYISEVLSYYDAFLEK